MNWNKCSIRVAIIPKSIFDICPKSVGNALFHVYEFDIYTFII